MAEVEVLFHKFDGTPHRRSTATHLGEDKWGTWLGSPVGAEVHHLGTDIRRIDQHRAVRLIPRDGWFTTLFFAPTRRLELYCDIVVPAQWTGPAQLTVVDLDLDVTRTHAGKVELLDEDEFAEHQISLGYPDDVIDRAATAGREAFAAARDRTEPFGTHYRSWLALV